MTIPKMLANMRHNYNPDPKHAIYRRDGQGAGGQDKEPMPSEPTAAETVHMPEDKPQQEIRLALAGVHEAVEHMTALGSIVGRAVENIQRIYSAPIYETASLSNTLPAYIIHNHQRNHCAVFVGATQTISLLIPSLGTVASFNLAVGWNQLDFPPGTEITGTTSTVFSMLVLYSMDRVANA